MTRPAEGNDILFMIPPAVAYPDYMMTDSRRGAAGEAGRKAVVALQVLFMSIVLLPVERWCPSAPAGRKDNRTELYKGGERLLLRLSARTLATIERLSVFIPELDEV